MHALEPHDARRRIKVEHAERRHGQHRADDAGLLQQIMLRVAIDEAGAGDIIDLVHENARIMVLQVDVVTREGAGERKADRAGAAHFQFGIIGPYADHVQVAIFVHLNGAETGPVTAAADFKIDRVLHAHARFRAEEVAVVGGGGQQRMQAGVDGAAATGDGAQIGRMHLAGELDGGHAHLRGRANGAQFIIVEFARQHAGHEFSNGVIRF